MVGVLRHCRVVSMLIKGVILIIDIRGDVTHGIPLLRRSLEGTTGSAVIYWDITAAFAVKVRLH